MWDIFDQTKILEFFQRNTTNYGTLSIGHASLSDSKYKKAYLSLDSCVQDRKARDTFGFSLKDGDRNDLGYVVMEEGTFKPHDTRFGLSLEYEAISIKMSEEMRIHTYLHGTTIGELTEILLPAGSVKIWAKKWGENVSISRRDHVTKEIIGKAFNWRMAGDIPYFEQVPSKTFIQDAYRHIPVNPEPIRIREKIRNIFYNPHPVTKK